MNAPMNPVSQRERIERLLYCEASLLDDKKWRDWLDLYTEDAVYWMPAWTSEYETTSDPELQLNLLYLKGRASLEDRVFRIETGDSFASVPMARTTHVVGGVLVGASGVSGVEVRASWIVHSYGIHGGITRSGAYDYLLRDEAGVLKIARKKITMIDDKLVGPVDIFHV
jgi:3-phenylpropionate/cinnamic acid dioxygenase small subunit